MPDFVGERLERLGEPLGTERRAVQVADERPDAIRGLLLGLPDLVELFRDLAQLALVHELARHVDLDRQPEQHLGQVVMEVAGDLESFVSALLRHPVRQRLENLLALLQLLVGLLQRLRSEEHRPGEKKWSQVGGQGPRPDLLVEDGKG